MAIVTYSCTKCKPIDKSILEVYIALKDLDNTASANEDERVAAEEARVEAETDRAEEFALLHEQAGGDHSVAEGDHTRAEADHATASADHENAVADRNGYDADHTAAVADHAVAASDHVRAEQDHTRAEDDHTRTLGYGEISERDHARAEEDHEAIFDDHSIFVDDHNQYLADHATAEEDHAASVSATADANEAAELANAKSELVQDRLDTADEDHARAVSDHSTAASDHTRAASDHTTAQADHTAAASDHSRAASDHSASDTATAAATGAAALATSAAELATEKAALVQDALDVAGEDHTRAEADHTRAGEDHTQVGTDHATAVADHAQAGADHTQAGADHTTAAADHTAAASDRALAASDHTTAEADHTTAGADHTQALADHAIAENDHATLDERIAHKADIDGSYDGMAVGIARNLEGRTDVTDSFFKRTTGGDAEVANGTAQLNEVKGKSQVWNQLLKTLENAEVKPVPRDNDFTYNGSVATASFWNKQGPFRFNIGFSGRYGHKMFFRIEHYNDDNYALTLQFGSNNNNVNCGKVARIVSFPSSSSALYNDYVSLYSGSYNLTNVVVKNLIVLDLTLLGIDNLTTVEEVEAWLAENIGEMPYYPYNAGEVLNNRMTGVESIGFNLLDPATGKADILGAYSDVYGNYYGITGTHGTLTFTDKFGNTETVTPDEDGKFLLETAGTLSVADAGEDCAVFLWWDGTQTEYKPYEKNVGALDVTHIYGKLNGEGEYVRVWPTGMPGIGDIKDSLKVVDGQVVAERKIGAVDLGSLETWVVRETYGGFRATFRPFAAQNFVALCSKFLFVGPYSWTEDKQLGYFGGNNIFYKDSSVPLTDEGAAQVKTLMSGAVLYYELETPQVFTDLIYRDSESFADNTPVTLPVNYKVDNWGIERIAPQNTEEAVVTTKPELTMRYSIDAVEELNTHRDEIDDLYEKNEELDQRKPEKYGEYPDMAVGSAKTLAGNDTKVEDFFFKALDCADGLAKLNSARGKSLVWNQQAKEISTDNYNTPAGRASINNGELTVYGAVGGRYWDNNLNIRNNPFVLVSGHKVFLSVVCTNYNINSSVSKIGMFCGQAANHRGVYVEISGVGRFSNIVTLNETIPLIVLGYVNTPSYAIIDENDSFTVKNIQIVDLTLMFGAGNEPATVAEFEAMFPLPYYDYNPGEIISNKTEEVKVTGFNQWDEEWEVGDINASTGEPAPTQTAWRTKNFIPILPNTQYFLTDMSGQSKAARGRFYDSEKNYIGSSPANSSAVSINESFTPPSNARYLKFAPSNSVVPPGTKLCLNLSDPSRNGEYEPYKTNTIELNLPTLTGKLNGEGESVVVFPDGLKSAGSVYDEIVGNKAIKRIGVVDLGTLNWVATTNYFYTGDLIGIIKERATNTGKDSIISEKYITTGANYAAIVNATTDKEMCVVWTTSTVHGRIMIRDSAYSDAATFKSAMDGVLLYYELATPEEYILDTPIPDTFQAYKGGTIKQLPENGSAPVTAPMVMTVTYAIDAVGTLVGLPRNYVSKESLQAMLNAMQSAGIIASYTMTYNENTGKYDFTFVAPTNS